MDYLQDHYEENEEQEVEQRQAAEVTEAEPATAPSVDMSGYRLPEDVLREAGMSLAGAGPVAHLRELLGTGIEPHIAGPVTV